MEMSILIGWSALIGRYESLESGYEKLGYLDVLLSGYITSIYGSSMNHCVRNAIRACCLIPPFWSVVQRLLVMEGLGNTRWRALPCLDKYP